MHFKNNYVIQFRPVSHGIINTLTKSKLKKKILLVFLYDSEPLNLTSNVEKKLDCA